MYAKQCTMKKIRTTILLSLSKLRISKLSSLGGAHKKDWWQSSPAERNLEGLIPSRLNVSQKRAVAAKVQTAPCGALCTAQPTGQKR